MRVKRLTIALAGVLSLAAAGCTSDGPELATVTGTVTLDGQPLEAANVMFQPQGGRPSFGTTDVSGRYELGYTIERPGAMLGEHTVGIRTRVEDDNGRVVTQEKLPPKYHDQTELKATVEAGENVIDFPLTSK